MLSEPILDYQTPEQVPPSRLLMRSLTLVLLCPLVFLKGWAFFNVVENEIASWGSADVFWGVSILSALSVLLAADLFIFWRLTGGWARTKKWIWPRAIYISVPANLLIGGCLYWEFVPLDLRTHPVLSLSGLCPVAYTVLVLVTFALADQDRASRRGLRAASQENHPLDSR